MASKLKGRKKNKGKSKTPPNFNNPAFEGKSTDRNMAKKKVRDELKKQGITGLDASDAMQRGTLSQDSSGNYIFRTDAYSKAD